MAVSQVRQNYHQESEEGVNKQINLELYAMYTYLSMVSYLRAYLVDHFSFLCFNIYLTFSISRTTSNATMSP